ncbi:MAG: hypothetical protein COW00_18760 [Bdellovibrio sp. CG12_big_fil_rev_8_21_14_0_65_39_13]|nr:MAG: hypothetical protein COW00_18760 [Bdellovibrio sp. CG12_big_fil_rev_8_21_14_0_65_39_13]PIR33993.1 MAG: hypothetical protein COV37_14380 [Bdellovibrio sp. CG11_big_fil_rev_8_21_14_0_20_39_38]
MKTIKLLSLLLSLISSHGAFSMSKNELSKIIKSELFESNGVSNELIQLKQKEELLRAILKNSEFIQFKDGTIIDLQDFEEINFKKPLNDDQSENSILEKFQTIEGGGTGHGG